MSKLTPDEIGLLQLIMRSPDIGDGWRQCAVLVFRFFDGFKRPELIEKDAENMRIRLSECGKVVVDYI